MTRILNAELFRLKKQKSSWILLAVLLFYTLVSGLYMGLALGNAPWLQQIYAQVEKMYASYGLSDMYEQIAELRSSVQFTSYAGFVSMVMPSGLLLFLAFFLFLFQGRAQLTGFYRNHFMKNTPADYVTAELVITMLYMLAGTAAAFLASLPGAYIFFHFDLFGEPLYVLLYVVMIWLLLSVGGMILLLIQLLARRVISGIFLGLAYALFLSDIVYQMINQIAQYALKKEIAVEYFTIFGNFSYTSYGDLAACGRALICVGIYGILAVFLCTLVLRKKDKI